MDNEHILDHGINFPNEEGILWESTAQAKMETQGCLFLAIFILLPFVAMAFIWMLLFFVGDISLGIAGWSWVITIAIGLTVFYIIQNGRKKDLLYRYWIKDNAIYIEGIHNKRKREIPIASITKIYNETFNSKSGRKGTVHLVLDHKLVPFTDDIPDKIDNIDDSEEVFLLLQELLSKR